MDVSSAASPDVARSGVLESRKRSSGGWFVNLRSWRALRILPRMILEGLALACAIPLEVSWNRFSFCSGIGRSKPRNDTWALAKDWCTQSMIVSASSLRMARHEPRYRHPDIHQLLIPLVGGIEPLMESQCRCLCGRLWV